MYPIKMCDPTIEPTEVGQWVVKSPGMLQLGSSTKNIEPRQIVAVKDEPYPGSFDGDLYRKVSLDGELFGPPGAFAVVEYVNGEWVNAATV